MRHLVALFRATAVALSCAALGVTLWHGLEQPWVALAFGPEAYAAFTGWMGSPLGLLVWFGLTISLAYHLAAGVRHLIWDAGEGLTPKTANALATASIAFAVVVAVAFWAGLFMTGRVVL